MITSNGVCRTYLEGERTEGLMTCGSDGWRFLLAAGADSLTCALSTSAELWRIHKVRDECPRQRTRPARRTGPVANQSLPPSTPGKGDAMATPKKRSTR